MMRVGLSANSYTDIHQNLKKFDGIGNYTYHLYQQFAQTNHITARQIYFKNEKEFFSCAINTNLSAKKILKSNSDFIIAANRLAANFIPWKSYTDLENKIDLLHITDYFSPKFENIPVISTLHDAIMLKHPEWVSPKLRPLKNWVLKNFAKNADHIITVSQSISNDIMQYFNIPAVKLSVIYQGINSIWFEHEKNPEKINQVLKKYHLEDHQKSYFITIGTLQTRKNIERIINAYLSLPKNIIKNFKLIFAGNYLKGLTPPALIHKIKHYHQENIIQWISYIPFEDLLILYQNAYLSLFPSLEEGFGFPIVESFASQTPVITSHYGAMAEIAADGAYLVDPYSEENISDALLTLVNNQVLRETLIKKGFDRAHYFTWQKCAQQTLAVYKKFF